MSSLFKLTPDADRDVDAGPRFVVGNPWRAALGALAGVLVVGGLIAVMVGLSALQRFQDTVLGQSPEFDQGAIAAIVGAAAIALGVLIGACWLVLGAVVHDRRH